MLPSKSFAISECQFSSIRKPYVRKETEKDDIHLFQKHKCSSYPSSFPFKELIDFDLALTKKAHLQEYFLYINTVEIKLFFHRKFLCLRKNHNKSSAVKLCPRVVPDSLNECPKSNTDCFFLNSNSNNYFTLALFRFRSHFRLRTSENLYDNKTICTCFQNTEQKLQ